MKKIIISLSIIAAVAAVVVGGTTAFFSDTETSTGNTFTAGAIDLKIDNHSWYYGPEGLVERDDLSWQLDDLDGHLFFNYEDLKPGDWGEDTISVHVNNNDAWVCADVYVTRNDDMSSTEPELEAGDAMENPQDRFDGELAQELQFFFWVDDGDNVFEEDESVLAYGPASDGIEGIHIALADSRENNVGGEGPLMGGETYYIGKVWCYGGFNMMPVNPLDPTGASDNSGPDVRNQGVYCTGEPVSNMSQTDAMMVDVSFYAVQARHNEEFVCDGAYYKPDETTLLKLENKDANWQPILGDDRYGWLTFVSANSTFDYSLDVYGLDANEDYTLLYYADPWPSTNGIAIGTFTTDAAGKASVAGNPDINADLPVPADANYPTGAKIWVIPSADWDGAKMTGWNTSAYLFEWNFVTYDDTDL